MISFGAAGKGKVDFAAEFLPDGAVLSLGEVTLEVMATPGHTPESISIVVREHPTDDIPYGVLTGDTLFIGDVGRPDLLASAGESAEDLARQLYRSLREKLMLLPDATRVFPAHGAGSACGKNLSTETQSTIGEQRRWNYALRPMTEDAFVDAVLQGQAAAPLYFSFSASRNRQAHELLQEEQPPTPLSFDEVIAEHRRGATIVDCRDDIDFAAGHIHGSINVGLGGRFAEYTGEVVAPGTRIVLVAPAGHETEARVRLARIGFDTVVGALADPVREFLAHPTLIDRCVPGVVLAARVAHRSPDPRCARSQRARGGHDPRRGDDPSRRARAAARRARPRRADGRVLRGRVPIEHRGERAYARRGSADVSDLLGGWSGWVSAGLPVA